MMPWLGTRGVCLPIIGGGEVIVGGGEATSAGRMTFCIGFCVGTAGGDMYGVLAGVAPTAGVASMLKRPALVD